MKLLFVYGSLRKDLGNHGYLEDENVSYLGNFTTEPEWTMFSLGAFPGIVPEGNTAITGEVYAVPRDVYEAIEHLEGYPTFYQRKTLETPYGEAEVYFLDDGPRFSGSVVHSGDWKSYINERYSH